MACLGQLVGNVIEAHTVAAVRIWILGHVEFRDRTPPVLRDHVQSRTAPERIANSSSTPVRPGGRRIKNLALVDGPSERVNSDLRAKFFTKVARVHLGRGDTEYECARGEILAEARVVRKKE